MPLEKRKVLPKVFHYNIAGLVYWSSNPPVSGSLIYFH
jgi:hypothetical protein